MNVPYLTSSGAGPSETWRPPSGMCAFEGKAEKHILALSSSQFDPKATFRLMPFDSAGRRRLAMDRPGCD
jgi:hypothetical protein